MSFLLDTNVVSEWVKPRPEPSVVRWLAEADEDDVFLSVVTFAEIRHGIERLSPGRRRRDLDEWLRVELSERFEGRIIPIGPAVADSWGVIVAQRDKVGRPIGSMDAFIAATATVHALTLVTRNPSDFKHSVKSVLNPWIERNTT